MNRTPSELRQAAIDSGWANDPLAEEILDALAMAAAQDAKAQGEIAALKAQALAPASNKPVSAKRLIVACIVSGAVAVVLGVAFVIEASARRDVSARLESATGRLASAQEIIAAKDAELLRLREAQVAQASLLVDRLKSALDSADELSKSNRAVYTSTIEALLTEIKQARTGNLGAAPAPDQPKP